VTTPKDTYTVPTGSYLGQMTDELRGHGEGAYIQEFVAGGPKNYGFRVHNKNGDLVEETSKIRGIRLNFKNKKTVNFDVIKSCVFEFCMQDNVHVKNCLNREFPGTVTVIF